LPASAADVSGPGTPCDAIIHIEVLADGCLRVVGYSKMGS
jgi:hypothetical protein